MLDQDTKRRIDTARDILVGKLPNPQAQVEQITIAMIYKFMDDMDKEAMEFGGEATFFTGEFEKYSWTKIFDPKLGGFEMLALYGEAIVKLNQNPNIPQLFRDIFKNAFLPYRDPETLKMFLKIINEFHYDHSEKLGDAFEYLLSVLGSQGDAGQFRTPRHIIDFMVAIMQPKKEESICDPACGTAGFLISSYKHILNENTKKNSSTDSGQRKGDLLTPDDRKKLINNFVGYDISAEMVRLSLVNLYLHGFTTPKIFEYDTLTSEDRWGDYFDIILANPPFMTPKGGIRPHKKFAMQAKRSEVLFVDYIMEHINPTTGRAAIIVPEGIIFQSATAYKALRKLLVDKNFLYGVVSLPAGIFQPYSGVKTSILLLDKSLAKKTDNILFVKIENDGFGLGAQRKELATSDLPDATNFINLYNTSLRNDDYSSIDFDNLPLSSLVVEKTKIAENGDYSLAGDRYRVSSAQHKGKFDFVELSAVTIIQRGSTITKKDAVEGEIPVIAGGQQPAYYHNVANRKGNVITVSASGAYAGFINFFESPIFASDCSTIETKDENELNIKFLYHSLKSKQEDFYKFQIGGGQPHVYATHFANYTIPLPPISIQKDIVAKIEQYEKIIEGAKQVTENYNPQIEINSEWQMAELGSVCDVISGYSFDSKDFSTTNTIKSIKITNVGVGYFNETETDYLPKDYLEVYQKYLANENDIVIALTRSIIGDGLKVCKVPKSYDNSLVNQRVALIKVDVTKINREFVFMHFNSAKVISYIEEKARSLMQPNLSIKDLSSLLIPLPSLEEQEIIITRIQKEQVLINGSKELIQVFEQRIKDEINKLWAE